MNNKHKTHLYGQGHTKLVVYVQVERVFWCVGCRWVCQERGGRGVETVGEWYGERRGHVGVARLQVQVSAGQARVWHVSIWAVARVSVEGGRVGDVAGHGDALDVVGVGGDHVQGPAHHWHQDGEVGPQLGGQCRGFYAAFETIKYFLISLIIS